MTDYRIKGRSPVIRPRAVGGGGPNWIEFDPQWTAGGTLVDLSGYTQHSWYAAQQGTAGDWTIDLMGFLVVPPGLPSGDWHLTWPTMGLVSLLHLGQIVVGLAQMDVGEEQYAGVVKVVNGTYGPILYPHVPKAANPQQLVPVNESNPAAWSPSDVLRYNVRFFFPPA